MKYEPMSTSVLGVRFRAPLSLRRLCALGQLGKKTGAGIYRYDGKGAIVAASASTGILTHPANH